MRRGSERGFTLVEIMLALALTAMIALLAATLSGVMDKSNVVVNNWVEAEHSGQATMDYVVRELQTAKNFYFGQASGHYIGYRRSNDSLSRLSIWNHLLIREECGSSSFPALPSEASPLPSHAEVVSDGINVLDFAYTKDGATSLVPDLTDPTNPTGDPSMFYVILVSFSVTVGRSTVGLQSAAFTLNIEGQLTGVNPGEVR